MKIRCLSWAELNKLLDDAQRTYSTPYSTQCTCHIFGLRNKQMIAIQPSVICFHNAVLFGIDFVIWIVSVWVWVYIGHGCKHIAHRGTLLNGCQLLRKPVKIEIRFNFNSRGMHGGYWKRTNVEVDS